MSSCALITLLAVLSLLVLVHHVTVGNAGCTQTGMTGERYWMVDLGEHRPKITRVVLGDDQDGCCGQSIEKVVVRIGDHKNHTINQMCYTFTGRSGPFPVDEYCDGPLVGRHVSVQLSLEDPGQLLAFCSIYIYATDLVGGEYLVTSISPDFEPAPSTPNPRGVEHGLVEKPTVEEGRSKGENSSNFSSTSSAILTTSNQPINIRMVTMSDTYNEIWVIASIIGIIVMLSLVLILLLTVGRRKKTPLKSSKAAPELSGSSGFQWHPGSSLTPSGGASLTLSTSMLWDQFSLSAPTPPLARHSRLTAGRLVGHMNTRAQEQRRVLPKRSHSTRPITVKDTDPGARNLSLMYDSGSLMLEPLEFEFDGLRKAMTRTSFQSIKHPFAPAEVGRQGVVPGDVGSTPSTPSSTSTTTTADIHMGRSTARTPSKISDDSGFDSISNKRKRRRNNNKMQTSPVDTMDKEESNREMSLRDGSSWCRAWQRPRSRSYTETDFDLNEEGFTNASAYHFQYEEPTNVDKYELFGTSVSNNPSRSKSYGELFHAEYDWSDAGVASKRRVGRKETRKSAEWTDSDVRPFASHVQSQRLIPSDQLAGRMRSLQSLVAMGNADRTWTGSLARSNSDSLSDLGLDENVPDYNYYNLDSHRDSIHI